MNRRIYKKQCKRAAEQIRQHCPDVEITLARGDETVCGPRLDEQKAEHCRVRRLRARGVKAIATSPYGYITPLKGTPIVWERTSYEVEEYDAKGALEWWDSWRFWSELSDTDYKRMLGEA